MASSKSSYSSRLCRPSFFALIFCGYGARRLRVLGGAAIAGVNTFVFYFALPVAANVFIIARQYDAYPDRASNAVLVSTVASIRSRSCNWRSRIKRNSHFVTVLTLLLVLTPA